MREKQADMAGTFDRADTDDLEGEDDEMPADIFIGGEQIVSANDWPVTTPAKKTETKDREPDIILHERYR